MTRALTLADCLAGHAEAIASARCNLPRRHTPLTCFNSRNGGARLQLCIIETIQGLILDAVGVVSTRALPPITTSVVVVWQLFKLGDSGVYSMTFLPLASTLLLWGHPMPELRIWTALPLVCILALSVRPGLCALTARPGLLFDLSPGAWQLQTRCRPRASLLPTFWASTRRTSPPLVQTMPPPALCNLVPFRRPERGAGTGDRVACIVVAPVTRGRTSHTLQYHQKTGSQCTVHVGPCRCLPTTSTHASPIHLVSAAWFSLPVSEPWAEPPAGSSGRRHQHVELVPPMRSVFCETIEQPQCLTTSC